MSLGRLTASRYPNIGENRLTRLPDTIGDLSAPAETRALDPRWNDIGPRPRLLDVLARRGCVVLR